ncbi:MAG: DUF58 domain-containing protein [Desulfuromonadales bacterium]
MTLFLGFAAVNTGNNLLYLLVSALLGFMAVSGVLGRGNIAGLSVAVEVPDEIYDARSTLVTVRLHNEKRLLGAFLVRVILPDGNLLFTAVGPRASAVASLTCTFSGRGTRPLGEIQLSSPFPINFFVRRATVGESRAITVFPAPRRCPPAGNGKAVASGEAANDARGYEGDISRIADYRGEPMKLIHWKLSARQDELKVRELSAAACEPLIIDLASLPGNHLEERLGHAAHLIQYCLQKNRPVGLRLGSRMIAPALSRGHKLRLMTELANYVPA